ncbi:nucleotidyltransferase family protein [Desulfosediminicola sp.]|uniref:nucleotidyltransferase family protein n=1 Tax=Desulfosediminicola sp. TaxID=2886825 RepID=UPI003AF2CE91
MKEKRAVILAGGKGTRLRPYTVVLPKPLMPVGDYSILEVIIRQLLSNGFNRITLAVNHQAEIIKAFFGDGSKWGISIDYSLELTPLGTMGPLKLIPDLPEDFLVLNGDILTDLDFARFFEQHVESGNLFTISSYLRVQNIDYGVLETDQDNRLVGFQEKPNNTYQVSMGIYMVNRKVLSHIADEQTYGFDNLMHDLMRSSLPIHVERFSGYWLDIGRPDDYMQAIEEFETWKEVFIRA